MTNVTGAVLLTDHPWPGIAIERDLVASAGYELREAPPGATEAELVKLADQAAGILTCWAPVSAAMIAGAGSQLRGVARLGVGVDNIDLAAARAAGATVTYVPGYCAEEISDHVVGLVFSWARQIPWYSADTRQGCWQPLSHPTRRLREQAIGIVGAGAAGSLTAEKFRALGCAVQVKSRPVAGADQEAELCDFAARVDVLSLHVPLRPDTKGMLSPAVLAAMRPGSLLVNTSRGQLVDTKSLIAALDEGRPGYAALDVLDTEPVIDEQLRTHPRVILTPHVAFASSRSIEDVRRSACEDLLRVLAGEPPLRPAPAD